MFQMDIEHMSISSPQKMGSQTSFGTPKSSSSYMPSYLIGNMNTPGFIYLSIVDNFDIFYSESSEISSISGFSCPII